MSDDDRADTPTAPQRDQPRGNAALLIVDMINGFDFPGGEEAMARATEAARAIAALRDEADRTETPVIYINDNFGEWHSQKSRLVEQTQDNPVTPLIAPRDSDYFIIKPQFSGFYATNLPVLLPKLGVDRLVLTGIATEICILFTAADAHMRDYRLWVPEDAVASVEGEQGKAALAMMRSSMGAEIKGTGELSLLDWSDRQAEHA